MPQAPDDSLSQGPWPRRTERLLLRAYRPADGPRLLEIRHRPEGVELDAQDPRRPGCLPGGLIGHIAELGWLDGYTYAVLADEWLAATHDRGSVNSSEN